MTATLQDHRLYITGNGAGEDVLVGDYGNGAVVVSSRGNPIFPVFHDVGSIIVQLGGGSDNVMIGVPPTRLQSMDVRVFMGSGYNQFQLASWPAGEGLPAGNSVNYSLYVSAGENDDIVSLMPDLSVRGEQRATAKFTVDLGAGDDSLVAGSFFGSLPTIGSVLDVGLTVQGRAGNDVIDVDLVGREATGPNKVGRLDLALNAGGGDNSMSVMLDNLDLDLWSCQCTAGGDDDNAIITNHNVAVSGDSAIKLILGGGNDSASFIDPIANEYNGDLDIEAVLGDGADKVMIIIPYCFVGGESKLSFSGESGNDFLNMAAVDIESPFTPQIISNGDDGNDVIHGTAHGDILDGGKGNDLIYGKDGSDIIHGGEGKDQIGGGVGSDLIDGGRGDDWLFGDNDFDIIHGGSGKDYIDGGYGNDMIYGEGNDDYLFGSFGEDLLDGGAGFDRLDGWLGNDILQGGINDLALDKLIGGGGADTFHETAPPWADILVDFNAADGDMKI